MPVSESVPERRKGRRRDWVPKLREDMAAENDVASVTMSRFGMDGKKPVSTFTLHHFICYRINY